MKTNSVKTPSKFKVKNYDEKCCRLYNVIIETDKNKVRKKNELLAR